MYYSLEYHSPANWSPVFPKLSTCLYLTVLEYWSIPEIVFAIKQDVNVWSTGILLFSHNCPPWKWYSTCIIGNLLIHSNFRMKIHCNKWNPAYGVACSVSRESLHLPDFNCHDVQPLDLYLLVTLSCRYIP